MKKQILISLLMLLPLTTFAGSNGTPENEAAQVELMLMSKHPICSLNIQEIEDCFACGSPYSIENNYTRITIRKKNGLSRTLKSGHSYDGFLKTLLNPAKIRNADIYKDLQLFNCFDIESHN